MNITEINKFLKHTKAQFLNSSFSEDLNKTLDVILRLEGMREEKQSLYQVEIEQWRYDSKISAIKTVRTLTGLGLRESREFVEGLRGTTLLRRLSRKKAKEIALDMEPHAEVKIKKS